MASIAAIVPIMFFVIFVFPFFVSFVAKNSRYRPTALRTFSIVGAAAARADMLIPTMVLIVAVLLAMRGRIERGRGETRP